MHVDVTDGLSARHADVDADIVALRLAFAEPMAEGTRGFWFIHGRSIPPRLLPNTAEEAE